MLGERPIYSLTVWGDDPGSWDRCFCSTHMNTRGLVTNFERLRHVEIKRVILPHDDPRGELIPPCDVLLIHNYFASQGDFSFDVASVRRRAKKLALFLEASSAQVDVNFTFGGFRGKRGGATVPITLPAVHDLLRPGIAAVKEPNWVLLDHDWPEGRTCCQAIYAALKPLRNRFRFFQLERSAERPVPEWIEPIPRLMYPDYLNRTERMRVFIVTHAGSYNHSLVDMAARGIRVLALQGTVAESLVPSLGIEICGNAADLANHLAKTDTWPPFHPRLSATTSMFEVVQTMDRVFRAWFERK